MEPARKYSQRFFSQLWHTHLTIFRFGLYSLSVKFCRTFIFILFFTNGESLFNVFQCFTGLFLVTLHSVANMPNFDSKFKEMYAVFRSIRVFLYTNTVITSHHFTIWTGTGGARGVKRARQGRSSSEMSMSAV